jgi:hypothetical protein
MRAILATVMLAGASSFAAAPQPSFHTYTPDPIAAHPEWDAAYTQEIREESTGVQFMTPLVDHLPIAEDVPTPLAFNGYIAGASDHLSYPAQIDAYMRALAAASPRVAVFSIGTTEEGREMIAVAVADAETIAGLDRYKEITRRLADPRTLDDATARRLIAEGKPIYYFTGGLHSPETGSPEMLMELAYRLAVEDTPLIDEIRRNVITLITPVLEVDGRARMVDLWHYFSAHPDEGAPPLVYWGHYVGHDNNRDDIDMALDLTRNIEKTYFEWHPQVLHDLHESIPFLYVSAGTGPYNAWLDPLIVDQWQRMAEHEVQALTAMGLPGVWTHGFYDGWAPNYLFWAAMGHNSLGRFYETFGNMFPTTQDRVVRGTSERAWYRPNPPLPQVRWSLRDNVNYQQSGALLALSWTARHREEMLERFYHLGQRSVAKARTEGPAAYVFTADQPRKGQLRDLFTLLQRHGIEVSVADVAFTVKKEWPPKDAESENAAEPVEQAAEAKGVKTAARREGTQEDGEGVLSFPRGSFVVRMDQPYSRYADALLDTQYVRGEERVYDDTGWTLAYARDVQCRRVVNTSVLDVPMHLWDGSAPALGGTRSMPGKAAVLAVENHADTDLVRFRWALADLPMWVTEEATTGKEALPAGTVLVEVADANRERIASQLGRLDLAAHGLAAMPGVARHAFAAPRIALLHTWLNTQDEGWARIALDDLGVPYDYISTQDLAVAGDLRARWDVILFPPGGRSSSDIVNGMPPGPPIPWMKSELTPNWGRVDSTDDIRPGMGIAGVQALTRFVEDGGLLITVQDTAEWAIDYGLARYVRVVETPKLRASGSLLTATLEDPGSPVAYGYDATVPVYFSRGPVFQVGVTRRRYFVDGGESRPSGRGGKDDPDVPQGRPYVPVPPEPTPAPGEKGFQLPEDMAFRYKPYLPAVQDRPRVILAFPEKASSILLSGMLENGGEIAGKAVLVDCPRGRGHILLFGDNPMWRSGTQGSYALVMNAIASYDHLGIDWPPKAK